MWLEVVVTHFEITSGGITIGLDGQVALDSILADHTPGKTKDYDMVVLIKSLIDELPITVQFRWVEGHQDDRHQVADLDVWARLNILANDIAKDYWRENETSLPTSNLKLTSFALFYNHEWLQNYKVEEIYDELMGDKMGGLLDRPQLHGFIPTKRSFHRLVKLG